MKKTWLILLIIVALTAVAYWPVSRGQFLSMDDYEQVINNSNVIAFSANGLGKVFTSLNVGMYEPLTTLFYILIYKLFGLSSVAFHLAGLFLHLLNVVLVFCLGWLLYKKKFIALAGASLFALWPTQVEAVAWISAQSTLMASLFILLTLICFLLYDEQGRRKFLFGVYVFFILALLSKSTAVIIPVLLALLIYQQDKATWRQAWRRLWPLFLISLIFGVLTIIGRKLDGFFLDEAYGFLIQTALLANSLFSQAKLLVWPINLSCFYPQPLVKTDVLTLSAWLLSLTIIIWPLVLFFLRNHKKIFFALVWFLANIILCVQILPHTKQIAADRYNYLAMLGPLWLGLDYLYEKIKHQKLLKFSSIILVLILALNIWGQTQLWQNDSVAWENAAKLNPQSPLIWYNLAEIKRTAGDKATAEDITKKQLPLHPDYPNFFFLQGKIFLEDYNQPRQAIDYFQQAVVLNNKVAGYYFALALAQEKSGDIKNAIASYEQTLKAIRRPKKENLYQQLSQQALIRLKK